MKLELSGSILGANPLYIAEAITQASSFGLKRLHIDIMDGHYVKNISFGTEVISAIKAIIPKLAIDVHLMVNCTENLVKQCLKAKVDSISIHPKATGNPEKIISFIKESNCIAGIAINPDESINEFSNLIQIVDLVTLMSVTPGACGQKFNKEILVKIIQLRANFRGNITVDGGVNPEICSELVNYPITRVVAGSALFTGDIAKNITKFMAYCE